MIARTIATLLLLVASMPAWCEGVDAMSSIVLVSHAGMGDPFFGEAVVFVTQRFGFGPVGVIVNKPTPIAVSKVAPGFKRAGDVVYFGGPVEPDGLVVAFRAKSAPEGAVEVMEGVYMAIEPDAVRSILERDPPPQDLRVFGGLSAWGYGQLENEVSRGDWHLLRAEASMLFTTKPLSLWPELELRAASKRAVFH